MYAKNLKIHKGVTNRLQFQFLNQEQKNINFATLTNPVVVFRLISAMGDRELLKKQVNLVYPLTGLLEVVLDNNEVSTLPPEKMFYSLELQSAGFSSPVFIDGNAGARGSIVVEESIMPRQVSSLAVTIPSYPLLNPNSPSAYYSNTFDTDGKPYAWIQVRYNNFSGSIQAQGATSIVDTNWYDIDVPIEVASATTETAGLAVEGFHPYLRLKMVSGEGNVSKILVR